MNDDGVIKMGDRVQAWNEAAHERGEMFAFKRYYFSDEHVGFIEDRGEPMVVILTSEDQLSGICMTVDDARALGKALLECEP